MKKMLKKQKVNLSSQRITRQRGMVLIIAMIMVLLMTIVGLAAIRGSSLQELMAGNMRDMQLRFQAAEGGLRAGETTIRFNVSEENLPTFNVNADNKGFRPNLNLPLSTPVVEWEAADWNSHARASALDVSMLAQPLYVVEQIIIPSGLMNVAEGSGVDHFSQDQVPEGQVYRVSSRYAEGANSAAVVVQSVYKR